MRKYLRLHFSGHREDDQFWHVDEVTAVSEDHAACAEHHRAPEHEEEQRLGVVFVRKECGCTKHRHSEQQYGWKLK